MRIHRAGRSRKRVIAGAALALTGLAFWGYRHALSSIRLAEGHGTQFGIIYTAAFLILCWQMFACYIEPTWKATPRRQKYLNDLVVAMLVPAYNEDPHALKAGLSSAFAQTRRPDIIHVVDDGSKASYGDIPEWFATQCAMHGVEGIWVRQDNGGKRSTQLRGVLDTPRADVYLTVDSDGILDANAIGEVLKPFVDPTVYSVAGVVLALNNTGATATGARGLRRLERAFIARMTDLWFVVGQLTDRSAASTFGAVLVNSGPLAAYRAEILRDNASGYGNETFFGRRVEFSDDSKLTLYALQRGKAVQQPSAFVFTLMPETTNHHLRQYVRWMRGAFIRSFWRFKYLPLTGYAFWAHAMSWFQMVVSLYVVAYLFVYAPATDPARLDTLPYLMVVPLLVGYGQALRYLTISRTDQTFRSQLLTVALSPLATLWAFTVLRFVRWYGMATCLKTGWGTRQNVEVGLRMEIPNIPQDATVEVSSLPPRWVGEFVG
jgi:hyaluronan synthase